MKPKTLALWERFLGLPGGRWLFSRLVCFKAPYFATIRPLIRVLQPERCEVYVRKRRGVLNHIGTVHAIAMCNMAELAAGTMTEVTIPPTHRWIPKGMTVNYLAKATTDLRAVATPASTPNMEAPGDYTVAVDVRDDKDRAVFSATVTMWISPRRS